MSRFLTPSKIGLLVLVSIYTESRVSTPSTIPVLSFLVKAILRKASPWHEGVEQPLVLSIDDFQQFLLPHTSSIPGRTLWDLWIQHLWAISNFDALHIFFDSAISLLEKSREELLDGAGDARSIDEIHLSRNSPLGMFVRRSHLEFTRLQLHDGIKLWKDFVVFREPTYSAWRKRHPVGPSSSDGTQGLLSSAPLTALVYAEIVQPKTILSTASSADLERILAAQVDQMQKTGQRVPTSMARRLSEMLAAMSSTSSLAHYSAFLDAWRAGDNTSAFESLHRYFDYTMHMSGRNFYHYALLNMAFLYADFGCFTEAISAIKESIAMARENKDMACLNYSLSWLYNFSKKHREGADEIHRTGVLGTDKEALAFIKAKAKDAESWSLLSTCMLSEAELVLANGESIAIAFENIAKAAYLNHSKHISVSFGQQMITENALYARLGLNHMEWFNYDLFHACYASETLAQDRLHFLARGAMRQARGGKYDEAIITMGSVSPEILRVQKLHSQWTQAMLLLKLRQSLIRHDFQASLQFLSQAKAMVSQATGMGYEIQLSGVFYEMRRKDYAAALTELEKISALAVNSDGDIHDRLLLAALKADLYDRAGVPQKGFSIAVRVSSAAYKARIFDVLYRVVATLCRILMSLREFEAASTLLVSIMPQVLECEDRELAASCFLALADAQMGLAGAAPSASTRRKEHLTKALGYLERAFDEFSSIEDIQGQSEAMAKRAMIMRVTKDIVLANDYAAKYLDIRQTKRSIAG